MSGNGVIHIPTPLFFVLQVFVKEKVFVLNLADVEKKRMQAGNRTDAFQHIILKLVLICDHLRAQGIL